jgi:GNAT superfamily N-acetyltransferase
MSKKTKVSQLTLAQVLDLRSRLLRPGQPIANSQYAEDLDTTTFHLGILDEFRKTISVATFIQQSHLHFLNSKLSYRLRGMAIEPEFQKKGFGKSLLQEAEQILKNRGCDLIWFNARATAQEFYIKLGFQSLGKDFDIPGIGSHQVMYKKF